MLLISSLRKIELCGKVDIADMFDFSGSLGRRESQAWKARVAVWNAAFGCNLVCPECFQGQDKRQRQCLLPNSGADLQCADDLTLKKALERRREHG